jgi:flagellar biosynthetic protein FliQ
MTPQYVIALGKEAISLTLMISAPMLIIGLIVGVVISIFQAVTQIHEMTLTFVPKIIAVAVAMLIFLPWMINMMVDFTGRLFSSLPTLVG